MIDLFFHRSPNVEKVMILLEETGLAYRLLPMSDMPGGHFAPSFLRISPNNKVPVIVDHAPEDGGEPLVVFESAAILLYLAEKTGRYLTGDARARSETLQWLMWQAAGLSPISGQNGHFRHQAVEGDHPYALARFHRELGRLYAVLDQRLKSRDYIVDDYGLADIACHPWIATHRLQGIELDAFEHVRRWYDRVNERPAVQRAAAGYTPTPSARLDEAASERRYRQTAEMLRKAYAEMERIFPPAPRGEDTIR